MSQLLLLGDCAPKSMLMAVIYMRFPVGSYQELRCLVEGSWEIKNLYCS